MNSDTTNILNMDNGISLESSDGKLKDIANNISESFKILFKQKYTNNNNQDIEEIKKESSKMYLNNLLLTKMKEKLEAENKTIQNILNQVFKNPNFNIKEYDNFISNMKANDISGGNRRIRKKKTEIEREYTCGDCHDKAYGSLASLKQHIKLKHC